MRDSRSPTETEIQSLVSHHLRLLRAARLVRGTRHAKHVHYEADDHHIRHVISDMIVHAGEHEPEAELPE